LARSLKYRLPFVNVQGYECAVNFYFEGWTGGTTELTGGAKPFVLGEFNTDEDYFKPIRPQQATIEIIAKNGVISIDDFLADNDSDVLVTFDFGDWTNYWNGYLSQEDMQEIWIDTIHILTLRASDGFGDLKNVPLNDGTGAQLVGRFTPLQFIQYAGSQVNNFTDYYIISNLFHSSMTDATTDTGLDQCYVDARTFETSPTVFEDSYTVLEKINKAFSQTIFQYDGKWWIYRLEENFQSPTLELNVVRATPLEFPFRTDEQLRYDISVGVDESVYPISPEMIRFLRKPAKQTTITYNWENFDEIVCNESFTRGELLTESPTQITYSVDCWTFQEGNPEGAGDGAIGDPITTSGTFERRIDFIDGRIDDDYVVIEYDVADVDKWIRSGDIYVSQNDRMTISFQHKWGVNITASSVTTAYVLLYGDDSTYYTLQDDGTWSTSNSSFTSGVTDLSATFSSEGEDWMSLEVEADPMPKSGYFVILLYRKDDVTGATMATKYFKDLNVDIVPQIQDSQFREIVGDWDRYTIERNINNLFDDEIFLDDADSKTTKELSLKAMV
jgi:hypothetical protein